MKQKKIAIISSGYLPLPSVKGGAVETLIDILLDSNLINTKYTIDVYSIFDIQAYNESKNNPNVNYIYIKNSGLFNKINKLFRFIINKVTSLYIGNVFIASLIKKYAFKLEEYDYVIVENKPEFGLALKKYVKGKLIFHSHNDFLNRNTKNAIKIYDSYDEIFCLSNYILNRIKEIRPNENSNKVKLLYNGIDVNKFSNVNKNDILSLKNKLGINQNDFVYLYSGRLVREKGIKELIESFNSLKEKNIKLLITGSVGYGATSKSNFTKELDEMSKNNKDIIFTGYIEYQNMPLYYNVANVGIVPSMWEEPFALTVIEHLASGHPVIITNSGAMPELVNDTCSLIVDKDNIIENMKNAMIKIKNRNINRDDCILNASNFSKEKYINTFLNLLEEYK